MPSDFDFIERATNLEKVFFAPEIIDKRLNLPLLGEKIDVFSLGVMLFESLFGVPPF